MGVSIKKIMYAKAWEKLTEWYAEDPVFEAEIIHISQISYDRVENLEATLAAGMAIKCMVIDHDKAAGRIALPTKTLEPEPGDMLRDPEHVFALAEQTAAKYHARVEAEKLAREQAAKEMVLGLGDSLGSLNDVLQGDTTTAPLDSESP